jgi:hypothetical protein
MTPNKSWQLSTGQTHAKCHWSCIWYIAAARSDIARVVAKKQRHEVVESSVPMRCATRSQAWQANGKVKPANQRARELAKHKV